ncbi:hypothetical protein TNIN_455591 [Trichonephila inaurata madagascariensis]|uniref:Uncharacterized protein n=1 Tax=Trichonephila inaurata madagascariensis TaxID=2747483 RepID=A0A8X6WSL3_9ARAC|nr:hypothetical protein TNIN_455591 [Trichonephila inaurata madagascariensis]
MNVYKIVCPFSPRGTIAAEERTVRSRRVQPEKSSPYHLHSRLKFSGRQEQSRICRVQPYKRRSKRSTDPKEHSEKRNQIA